MMVSSHFTRRKRSDIYRFQLLKYESLLLFFLIYAINEESLGFGLLLGQKGAIWALGYCDEHSS